MMNVTAIDSTMTAGQAARRIKRSPQRLAQLALAGKIEYVSTPYGRLYPVEAVERLAAELERNGG